MKKLLFTSLALISAILLSACSSNKPIETDATLGQQSMVVNLSTPAANKATPSSAVVEDRYQLQLTEITSSSDNLSFSAKLLLRYTNKTDEPIYSVKFTLSDAVAVKGITVNSIATNYSIDEESSTLTVPVGAELAPHDSMSLYIHYTADNITDISDAVIRLCDISEKFAHSVSVTVGNDVSLSSSLGTPEISSSTNKTFSFSAVSDNNFTLTLD